MSPSTRQLANNLQASAQSALIRGTNERQVICLSCNHKLSSRAKFCGECGNAVVVKEIEPEPAHRAPSFAEVHTHQKNEAPKEMRDELDKLFAYLLRQRFFLVCHFVIFISLNLFGFSMAFKAYNEFIADEATKLMVAAAPISVINGLALLCIAQIRGTRKEIIRLKERLTYLHYKIEYWGLI